MYTLWFSVFIIAFSRIKTKVVKHCVIFYQTYHPLYGKYLFQFVVSQTALVPRMLKTRCQTGGHWNVFESLNI